MFSEEFTRYFGHHASSARGTQCNGCAVTDAYKHRISSVRRLCEHHMVSDNVCNAQDPVLSTRYAHSLDILVTTSVRRETYTRCNGCAVTDAHQHRILSARRSCEHRMVSDNRQNAQDPVLSTRYAHSLDILVTTSVRREVRSVTVVRSPTRTSTVSRRYGACVSTAWCQTMDTMLKIWS